VTASNAENQTMVMANFAFEGNINFSNDWLSKMTMNVWHQQRPGAV